MRKDRGITLTALVVSIIILLILAAVSLSLITGTGGLLARANYSVDIYGKKSMEEAERVNDMIENPYISGVNNSDSSSTNPTDPNNPQEDPIEPDIPDDTKLTGIVTFMPSISEWVNTTRDGAVKVTITTESGYDIQYSMTGNTSDWHSYPTGGIDVTTNNQTIYARLIETSTGKTSDNYSTTISNIDNVAPSAFTFDVATTETTIVITGNTSAHASETGQSPISYQYKIDNGNWQASNTFTGLTAGSTHTVYMKAVDGAGNETNGTNSGNNGMSVTTWAEVPDLSIASGNVTFTQNTNNWRNTNVEGAVKVYITTTASGFDLQYSLTGEENEWQAYTINGVDVTTNNQNVYARVIDIANNRAGGQAVTTVTNIDNNVPVVNSALAVDSTTTKSITTTINVTDADSGLGHITWYYKKSTDVEWQNLTDTYQAVGATAGAITAQTKTHTFENLDQTTEYNFYAEVYDVAGNMVTSGTSSNPITGSTETVTALIAGSNITFNYNPAGWTNQAVVITLTIDNSALGDNTLRYKIGNNGAWTEYNSTTGINMSDNNTVYFALYDGSAYGESATAEVTKIDKTLPTVSSALAKDSITDNSITTKITVMDTLSGIGRIVWYYKNLTDSEWSSVTDTYQVAGGTAGETTAQTKTHTFALDTFDKKYQFYAEVYDVAGNMIASKSSSDPLVISGERAVRYAVQVYGINQDEDFSGNTLGLTFGPAMGGYYNNAYVTHTYEETSEGSGVYNVIIETHTVASDGTETITTENLVNSEGNNVTRTLAEKNKYDVNMHDMTWTEIAEVSDKTAFTDCMLCGDTKSIKLKLNNTIKGSNYYVSTYYGDGDGEIEVDNYYQKWNPSIGENEAAINGKSTGTNAKNAGGYASSHIRATLIGENAKTDISYAGDNNLTATTCFYSCFEEDLRDVITAKKIKYITGTSQDDCSVNEDIADKIWLFSMRELYMNYWGNLDLLEGLGVDGRGYDKFGNTESKYYIDSYSGSYLSQRVVRPNNWFIRSIAFQNDYDYVFVMHWSGGYMYCDPHLSDGLAVGFCIDSVSTYTTEANATNIKISVLPDYLGADGTTYQYQINGGEWQNARLTTDSTHTFTNLTPGTQYTVNVKIGDEVQKPQTVTTPLQKTMKEVNTVEDAIRYSATAISATDTDYTGTFKELTDSTGAKVKVPVGFTVRYDSAKTVNDGIVVADQNDNQWVWIPVNASNPYTRTWFGTSGREALLKTSATSNEQVTINGTDYYVFYEAEPVSGDVDYDLANRAGGFYIARYEAGVSGATAMRSAGTNKQTVNVKKDQVPYNYVDIGKCLSLASGIANANSYKTGITTKLCSSYAWDTTLNFIGNESWSKGTGTEYQSIRQNYKNSATFKYLKYENGNLITADKTTNLNDGLMLTGQGDATKNIYDMGGNCREYTTEYCSHEGNRYAVRGGDCYDDYTSLYAGYRIYWGGSEGAPWTFRPTLYLSNIPAGLNSSNITFTYSTTSWTNQDVIVGVNVGNNVIGNNTIRYKIGSNGTWMDYDDTNKIRMTENNTIYVAIYDGENYGVCATTDVTKIDKTLPVANMDLGPLSVTNNSIKVTITVTDAKSGLGKIIWYYKNKTDSNWSSSTNTYQQEGSKRGYFAEQTKTKTCSSLTKGDIYQFYAEVYDVAGNMISSRSASNPLEIECLEVVKYAVQIYGINQDEDGSGNTLGLTFGPATGANYNNTYVTHEYEANGNEGYNVVIVTHNIASDGSDTTTTEYLKNSSGNNVTRTLEEKNKYDVNMHEMTWNEIAEVSDKTVFTDCMLCGDTKSVRLELNDTIKGSTINYQNGDGTGTLKSTLNAYYRRWNPNSTQNSYVGTGVTLSSSELSYGSNAVNAGGYSVSHIRATLIGKNAKTNEGYAGNVNLTEETCLYSCIESDLQNAITAKKIRYVTGTSRSSYNQNDDIADKIWLFSGRELYGTGQSSGDITEGLGTTGVGYDRYSNTESKYYISSPTTNSNTNRVCYAEDNWTGGWWLRSPDLNYTCDSCEVGDYGGISSLSPYYNFGLSFGFCIR